LTTFTSEDRENAVKKITPAVEVADSARYAREAPYHPGYEDAVVNPDQGRNLSEVIREQMRLGGKRFWAGDNISEYIVDEETKNHLIDEATKAFETVLDTLLIDRETDPNSRGTARRLAKMYFNEIMGGRYDPAPDATAFPNDSAGPL
jgi:hypothetical protein